PTLNLQIGCRYITQLVNGVEGHLYGNSTVKADLKNAHAFSMMMILTTFGLFKNEYPLTGNFTFEHIQNVEYSEYRTIHWSSNLYFEIPWNKFKKILGDKIWCDYEKLCAYP
ncbi:5287_t:CDS:2, partial [Funneliformis caledonium]